MVSLFGERFFPVRMNSKSNPGTRIGPCRFRLIMEILTSLGMFLLDLGIISKNSHARGGNLRYYTQRYRSYTKF